MRWLCLVVALLVSASAFAAEPVEQTPSIPVIQADPRPAPQEAAQIPAQPSIQPPVQSLPQPIPQEAAQAPVQAAAPAAEQIVDQPGVLPPAPVDLTSRLLSIPIPEEVTICGEVVPLDREDVRERLDYEMAVILGSNIQTSVWLKRVPRFFPSIESAIILKDLPADLKYVSVVESNLKPESLSSAGASGPWQFMPETARLYGLRREVWCDERRDWGRATDAALTMLAALRKSLGSWTLAFAAYNAGEGRVRNAMERQAETDFFGLKLPTETERYVLRIIAAKLILSDPARYGIDIRSAEFYPPLATREVSVELKSRGMGLPALAKAANVSYRYLLRLNPWLNGSDLPRGRYVLTIPRESCDTFTARLMEYESPAQRAERVTPIERVKARTASAAPEDDSDTLTYQVQPGDTLSSIAKRHDIRLDSLLSGNGLAPDSVIKPGQALKVPLSD
jgi:LysM repeat protein